MGRQRVIQNGVKLATPNEFQSFLTTVYTARVGKNRNHNQYRIHIPIQIARTMRLVPHEKIIVAIKRPTEQEEREYQTVEYY